MPFRKSIVIALLLPIVASVAYSGYWVYARDTAIDIIDRWAEQRRAEGYKVAYDPPELTGYPFLIRARLNQPRLTRGPRSWHGEGLRIEFRPWNFRRIRFDFIGRQWLTPDAANPTMLLVPGEAAIVASLSDSGRLIGANLLVRDLHYSEPEDRTRARIAEIWLEATAPETTPVKHSDNNLAVTLSAANIVLTDSVAETLGRQISKLRADLQLKGPLPGGTAKRAIEAWRDSGGTLDVDWFHIVWGQFDLRTKGTLALDAQVRPIGAFSTDIRGHNTALDALVARKILEQKTVALAKIGLSLLAKSPPEGGPSVLTIPVTAQDGHLYAGPIKILDLDPIRLPALVPPR